MNYQELLTYWRVVKKRWWLIALLMVVTLGGVLVASFSAPPLYGATASFQVTAPLPAEVSLFSEFKSPTSREELGYTTNNFVAILQSEFVAGEVIEELGLKMDIDEFLAQITIEPDKDSDFIKLKITAADPKQAPAIANTLLDRATRYFGELNGGSITANKEFIQQQLANIKVELEAAKAALIAFQLEHGIGNFNELTREMHVLMRQLQFERAQELTRGNTEAVQSYDQVIAKHQADLKDAIALSSDYQTLTADVDRLEALYLGLLDKETEAKLKENEVLSARFVRVIPAREHIKPLPRVNPAVLALAAFVSLALGVMLAFLLQSLETAAAQTRRPERASPKLPLDERGEALPQVR